MKRSKFIANLNLLYRPLQPYVMKNIFFFWLVFCKESAFINSSLLNNLRELLIP